MPQAFRFNISVKNPEERVNLLTTVPRTSSSSDARVSFRARFCCCFCVVFLLVFGMTAVRQTKAPRLGVSPRPAKARTARKKTHSLPSLPNLEIGSGVYL